MRLGPRARRGRGLAPIMAPKFRGDAPNMARTIK